uniref:Estradiol 17-beta-dehydrogenase 12 n=1 Tax=Aegilops tauschii subsp. strangulata TaxID=200361 RepID=A0A453RD48_AEGTS
MIRVNVLALTEVTAAVLPGMVRRGRGAVVNMGSGSASVLPSFPLYSVYAGTKRYVAEFSRSLAVEYGSSGIDVQCQVRSRRAARIHGNRENKRRTEMWWGSYFYDKKS